MEVAAAAEDSLACVVNPRVVGLEALRSSPVVCFVCLFGFFCQDVVLSMCVFGIW